MLRTYALAVAGIVTLTTAWMVSRYRRTDANSRRRELSEDCAVDECGVDRLPLNAYSG